MSDPETSELADLPPMTTTPPSLPESPPVADGRSEVGGLLFVVAALATVVQAATYAHALGSAGFRIGPTTGIEADIDWEAVVQTFAAQGSVVPAILLAIGVHLGRWPSWDEVSAAGRAALWIAFPLGLVVAASGAYSFVRAIADSQVSLVAVGSAQDPAIASRVGGSLSYLALAALAGHASWTAFGRLPLASSDAVGHAEEP